MKIYPSSFVRSELPAKQPRCVLGVDPSSCLGISLVSFGETFKVLYSETLRLTDTCKKRYDWRDQEAMIARELGKIWPKVAKQTEMIAIEIPPGGVAARARYKRADGTWGTRDFMQPTQMLLNGRILQLCEQLAPTMIITPPQVKQSFGISGNASKERLEAEVVKLIDRIPTMEDCDILADREAMVDASAIAHAGWNGWK